MDKNKYAILILAAGSSKRLGHPKQMISWNHSTLLNNTIAQALKAESSDVYLSLGGNQTDIRTTISHKIPIFDIPNWQEGMGSTISKSLSQLDLNTYEAIIISVCDQPFITGIIFKNLIKEFECGYASIVISKYRDSAGPPTLFGKKHFEDLLKLAGDIGAKKIVENNLGDVAQISFQKGGIDIDNESDFRNLMGFKEK